MADNLKVSEEAFNAAINNFNNSKIALQSCYTSIHKYVMDLQTTWKGEANSTFTQKFEELYKNVEKTETVMDNVISKLKQALGMYQEQDEQAKTLYSATEVGTEYKSNLA